MRYVWILFTIIILSSNGIQSDNIIGNNYLHFSLYVENAYHLIENSQGNFEKIGYEIGITNGTDARGFLTFSDSVFVENHQFLNISTTSNVDHGGVGLQFSHNNKSVDVTWSASCCNNFVVDTNWDANRDYVNMLKNSRESTAYVELNETATEFSFLYISSYKFDNGTKEYEYTHSIYDKATGVANLLYYWNEITKRDDSGITYHELWEIHLTKNVTGPYSRKEVPLTEQSKTPEFTTLFTMFTLLAIISIRRFRKGVL